jgi:hypothetical protein
MAKITAEDIPIKTNNQDGVFAIMPSAFLYEREKNASLWGWQSLPASRK